ncbi:hypothetical protein KAJ27_07000 [bacterium]|nr:hypothetical protein [bacterium]
MYKPSKYFLTILLFFVIYGNLFSGNSEKALKFIKTSQQLYSRNNIEDAIVFFYKALHEDENIVNKSSELSDYANIINSKTENFFHNSLFKARVLFNDGKYDKSISILQKIRIIESDNYELNDMIKKVISEKKQLQLISGQEKYRKKSLISSGGRSRSGGSVKEKKTPKFMIIERMLKQVDIALIHQDYNKAMSIINEALLIDVSNIALNSKIKELNISKKTLVPYRDGLRYYQQKQYKTALFHFLHVYEFDRNFMDIHKYIGICYIHLNEFKKAAEFIENFMKNRSCDIDIYTNLFHYFYDKGNYNLSNKFVAKIQSIRSHDRDLWWGISEKIYWILNYKSLILLFFEIGLLLYAVFTIYAVFEMSQKKKRLKFSVIEKLIHAFNYQKAIKILQDYLALYKTEVQYRFVLAYLLDIEKDLLGAKAQLQTVLLTSPDSRLARLNLASIHFKSGDNRSALGELISIFGDEDYKSVLIDEYKEMSLNDMLDNPGKSETIFYLLFNYLQKDLSDMRYLIK